MQWSALQRRWHLRQRLTAQVQRHASFVSLLVSLFLKSLITRDETSILPNSDFNTFYIILVWKLVLKLSLYSILAQICFSHSLYTAFILCCLAVFLIHKNFTGFREYFGKNTVVFYMAMGCRGGLDGSYSDPAGETAKNPPKLQWSDEKCQSFSYGPQ